MSEDWAAYFKNYRRDRNANKAEQLADLRPHSITHTAREVSPDRIMSVSPKTGKVSQQSHMGKVYATALSNGWEIKCGLSMYFSGDKLQANGKLVEGTDEEWTWLEAVKTPDRFVFSDSRVVLNGLHIDTKKLLAFIKGESNDVHIVN